MPGQLVLLLHMSLRAMRISTNMNKEYYESLEDDELIALSREQDSRAIEALISRYKGMVLKRARSMYILGGDSEDLIQEGMIGLFKASGIMTVGETRVLPHSRHCVCPASFILPCRPRGEKSTCR